MAVWRHKKRWYARAMFQGVTYRGERGYQTEDEARLELAKIRSGIRLAKSGGHLGPASVFRDAWTLYLQHSEAYNSKKWYEAKRYIGNRYFKKWFERKITAISRVDIETHLVERKRKSIRSANLDFEILGNFFNGCVQGGLMDKSPMRFLRKFARPAHIRVIPTPENIKMLIESTQGQDKLLCLLLVHTLGRISEILGLQWTDINFDKKVLYFKTRKTRDGSEKIREIPISGELFMVLLQNRQDSGYVLPSKNPNTPYKDLRKRLKKCLSLAGVSLQYGGFHQFRHYGISRLMEQGIDPATIRDLAGHATLDTTNIYSHSAMDTKRAAIETLMLR